MGGLKIEILIVDANVLIDFCKTDRSILTLVSRHVAAVNVAEPVLDEVKELDRSRAEELGLRVISPDFQHFSEAARLSQRSPLQFQDWLCLLLAEAHGWTCVTNDKRLRTECEGRGVELLWGLELLLRLVEAGALPADAAIDVARTVHSINKRLPLKIVEQFIRQAKKLDT